MEYCERCRVSEDKVRLFDTIYNNHMAFLCERCAIIENVPIVKRPDSAQLKNSEKTVRMFERKPVTLPPKKETFFREDRLKELDKNPTQELPDRNRLNLIDNFHWEIMRIRRRKGYSHKQLAEAIHESTIALEMIEKGKLPERSENLIIKLEQFFQINLRRKSPWEYVQKKRVINEKPVLLNKKGEILEDIPEDTFELESEEIKHGENAEPVNLPVDKDLDIKVINQEKITIGDLKTLHKKKIEATRQEQIEEQKKIEERRKILEAHRERDRLKIEERRKQWEKEKQEKAQTILHKQTININAPTKNNDVLKKNTDELRKKLIEQHQKEKEKLKEREIKDVDKHLGGMELLDE